jgi:hypothetical protein
MAAQWHDHRQLKCLWSEDDAKPCDRERITEAWNRLFNEPLPDSTSAIAKEDLGDCFLYLHQENRVAEYSCEGEAIYVVAKAAPHLPPEEEKDKKENKKEDKKKTLSEDQRQALDDIFQAIADGQQILVLTGAAGTGKTFLMGVFAAEAKKLGWPLIYLAPTGKAALRLSQSVGTKAFTVHSRLYKTFRENEDGDLLFLDPKPIGDDRTIVICDEASMVSETLHRDLVSTLPQGAILFYAGDREQIEPVVGTWGPDFDHPTAILDKVHRQALGDPILQVGTTLRMGGKLPDKDIGEAYKRAQGSLSLAAQWIARELKNNEDAVVLSWTNDTRQRLNKLVRHQLGYRDQGPVVVGEQLVVLLNNKHLQRNNGETIGVAKITDFGHHGILKISTTDNRLLFVQPNLIGADMKTYKDWMRKHSGAGDLRMLAHVDFGYGLTIHKCVHPDTLVETSNGIFPIREIPAEGTLETPKGPRNYRNKTINPTSRAIKIETKNGYSITITPDHGLDVWNGTSYSRQTGENLKIGDWLRLKLGPTGAHRPTVLLHSTQQIDSREKSISQPTTLTPEVAELLGLLVADGTLFHGGIRFIKRHPETVDRFGELCIGIFGKKPNKCQVHGTDGLELCSTSIRRWLGVIGGVAPWSKTIPQYILMAPEFIQAAFLRGLFEDGSVHLKKDVLDHIELRQDNAELIQTVRLLLLRQGIICGKVRGKLTMPNIMIYGPHLATFREKIGFISLKKRNALLQPGPSRDVSNRIPVNQAQIEEMKILAHNGHDGLTRSDPPNAKARQYITRAKASHLPFMKDSLEWHHDKIFSITETECPSVCVEIPDGHQFLQNGFAGWNSQGSEYDKVLVILDRKTKWIARQSVENARKLRRLLYTAATRAKKQLIVLDAP